MSPRTRGTEIRKNELRNNFFFYNTSVCVAFKCIRMSVVVTKQRKTHVNRAETIAYRTTVYWLVLLHSTTAAIIQPVSVNVCDNNHWHSVVRINVSFFDTCRHYISFLLSINRCLRYFSIRLTTVFEFYITLYSYFCNANKISSNELRISGNLITVYLIILSIMRASHSNSLGQ